MVLARTRASLVAATLLSLVVATAACSRPSPNDPASTSTTCPPSEPGNGGACSVPPGPVCGYTVPAVREVFCQCYRGAWSCGTPLGIDALENSPGCPASAPEFNAACGLQLPERDAYGNRPGCRYTIPATMTHDCVCAHFADRRRPQWDCSRSNSTPTADARGCPPRTPVADSLCVLAAGAQCQFGYNLSTTCTCTPLGSSDERKTWRCVTEQQPPSPSAPH